MDLPVIILNSNCVFDRDSIRFRPIHNLQDDRKSNPCMFMSKSTSFLFMARNSVSGYGRKASRALTALFLLGLPLTLPAQTLTITNTLQLWLKADAGVTADANGAVSAWTDSSGKGNNAAQADPTLAPTVVTNALNNKPVLRFDGVNDHLDVADSDSISISGDISSFFVVKFDDFATFRAVWAKTSVNFPAPNDWYTVPSSGIPRAYRGDGTDQNLGFVDGGALRAGIYQVVGFDMAGTNLTHYLAAQATGSGPITATLADADTPLRIGTRDDLFTKMKGDIAEILIYGSALSVADRTAVVDYLAQKYNIQNAPPTVSVSLTPAGPTVTPGQTITVTTTATDPDGSVAGVQFFVNGGLFATATAPPFTARLVLASAGAYVFTAQATDDKGAQASSAAVTLNAGPAATASLAVTNNLQLWLKADEGVTASAAGAVTAWADKSGKGNNAAQGDDTLAPLVVTNAVNGKTVLRFDGADDYLEVPDSDSISIAGDITTLFVVKMDDFDTFRAVWAKTQSNLPAPNDWYTLPSSGVPRLYRGNGTTTSLGSSDGGTPLRAGSFELAGYTAASNAITHHLNGRVTSTGTINAVPADTDTPLKIGTRDDFVTQMKGDIAEILIYNAALSDTDRKDAEIYLAGKYGLTLTIPTNTPPTVSLTAPTNGLSLSAPASVTVSATASDTDGAIARVDFLVNGAVVASDTNAPYSAVIQFPAGDQPMLTAVAIDNLGGATTSAPVAITVTSTVQIPLPAAANLKLWLSADKGVTATAGSVSAWDDQSGNLNNAAQSDTTAQPQLVTNAVNNMPVIRFDGDNDYLSVSNSPSVAIAGDLTTFFVVNFDDFDTFRAVWAKTSANLPAANDWYALPNTGIPRAYRGNGAAANGSVDGTTPLTAGEYLIVGWDVAGTTLRHYLNGDPNGEGQITAALADAGKPLLIGTRDDLFTKMKGDIAEIIIYNTALSDADRTKVVNYLGSKYGLLVSAGLPQLAVSRSGNNITISWPPDVTGFTLQSTTTLPTTTWQNVTGVVNNSVTVAIGAGNTFFRLFKP